MEMPPFLRAIFPREERFYDILELQAELTHEAALALAKFNDRSSLCENVRAEVQALEHKGDGIVDDMAAALARTFVTPMDREDLQRLSSKLDDVVDVANLVVRECVLFGVVRPTAPMSALIELFVAATRVLSSAVAHLRKRDFEPLFEDVRAIRKLEKEADDIFRSAISALFRDDAIDAKVLIREKQILSGLEHAVDECDHVATTLSNLAVKLG